MERIKHIVFSLLILIGLTIPSELYQSYTGCFSDFYEVSFYIPPDGSRDEMLADISAAAEQNYVSVSVMTQTVEDLFTNNITVYGDDIVRQHLETAYFLQEGCCKSLFSGSTTIQYFSLFDVPDELIAGRAPKYYLIGEFEDMVRMKEELVDTYAGSFPKVEDYSVLGEMKSIQLALWIILLLLLCFVAFYSLVTAQRELMVRVSMGERRIMLYLERTLKDLAVLIGSYLIYSRILSHFTTVSFLSTQRHWMFIGTVVSVSLVNAYLFSFRVRMAFQHVAGQKILTTGTYIIKVIACCFSFLTLTFAFSTITECLSFYSQRSFFEDNKTCHYVEFLFPGEFENEEQVETDFLHTYYEKTILSDLCYSYIGDADPDGNYAILMSHSMLPYLRKWIPSLNDAELTTDVCLLYPKGTPLTEEDQESLLLFAGGCYGCDAEALSVQSIVYPTGSKVIEIERNHLNYSAWKEDPVIVLTMWDELTQSSENDYNSYNFRTYNFMVDAPKEALVQFAQAYDCKVIVTNCYEYFLFCWKTLKRTLYLSVLLIVMLFWLNIAISILLVRFTYKKMR